MLYTAGEDGLIRAWAIDEAEAEGGDLSRYDKRDQVDEERELKVVGKKRKNPTRREEEKKMEMEEEVGGKEKPQRQKRHHRDH